MHTVFTIKWNLGFLKVCMKNANLVDTDKPVGLILNFGERKARPPRLSSRPACLALQGIAGRWRAG